MSATTEEDTRISIDLITSENNSIEILKSQRNDQPHTPSSPAAMSTAQMKVDLIDYYERMICEVDLHAERLIQSLPEALNNSRQELLERIEREKAKSLAALGMSFKMNLQLTFWLKIKKYPFKGRTVRWCSGRMSTMSGLCS
jgi:hypothetical protein